MGCGYNPKSNAIIGDEKALINKILMKKFLVSIDSSGGDKKSIQIKEKSKKIKNK